MIQVGDRTVAWRQGITVAELFEEIEDDYPYAAVKINNNFISRIHFDTAIVPDNTEVFLIPLIVGG